MKDFLVSYICHKLRVSDPAKIEIEAKKKLSPESAEELQKYLNKKRGVKHIKTASFMDQFVDTPDFDIFHSGASLRIRYKGDGSNVYVQYKGHGFSHKGILFRSEFSSGKVKGLVREESHHDIIHFAGTGLKDVLDKYVPKEMRSVITDHLGPTVIKRVTTAPVICFYRKDKYLVDMGKVALEPSLDHISAFHINRGSFHSLSNFWEYENEIKSEENDLAAKVSKLDTMMDFDAELAEKFSLHAEPMDKYHRVMSCFMKAPASAVARFSEPLAELPI
ncbi:MAG: CYTH domain-containing protein [Elusimicrobiales bacterium]|nr:CYTH domain-containing protein [Elusimicrobiales bacterium]